MFIWLSLKQREVIWVSQGLDNIRKGRIVWDGPWIDNCVSPRNSEHCNITTWLWTAVNLLSNCTKDNRLKDADIILVWSLFWLTLQCKDDGVIWSRAWHKILKEIVCKVTINWARSAKLPSLSFAGWFVNLIKGIINDWLFII